MKLIGYTYRIPYRGGSQTIAWLVDRDIESVLDWFANHEEYILQEWVEKYLSRSSNKSTMEIVRLNRERRTMYKQINNTKI